MFDNIIGYDYVKKELELIIGWYNNDEFLNNRNAKLPSGIIFYGPPGNGKTFFIREIKNQFKDNTFIINGDDDNILDEITSTYKKARENKLSLVLIDEIDLLIDSDKKALRVLQDELDGINNNSNRILTIATTNYLFDLPSALLRNGRMDRTIMIDNPNSSDRKKILDYYLNKLNVRTGFKSIDNVMLILSYMSCSDIMSICNDCYFRFNNEIITEEKLIESICKLDSRNSNFGNEKDKCASYHEIGHALMALKHSNYYDLFEVKFTDDGGVCKYGAKNNIYKSKDMIFASVEVALGGVVVEKLLFGSFSVGSKEDLQRARQRLEDYVNNFSYKSITTILKDYNSRDRMETEKTRYKNELIENKLLKKCYRRTYRYLKKHIKDIYKYGDLLYEKGYLIASDFNV